MCVLIVRINKQRATASHRSDWRKVEVNSLGGVSVESSTLSDRRPACENMIRSLTRQRLKHISNWRHVLWRTVSAAAAPPTGIAANDGIWANSFKLHFTIIPSLCLICNVSHWADLQALYKYHMYYYYYYFLPSVHMIPGGGKNYWQNIIIIFNPRYIWSRGGLKNYWKKYENRYY